MKEASWRKISIIAVSGIAVLALGQVPAKAQSSGGGVPTYLTNEIANYQAGLNRLLGGG